MPSLLPTLTSLFQLPQRPAPTLVLGYPLTASQASSVLRLTTHLLPLLASQSTAISTAAYSTSSRLCVLQDRHGKVVAYVEELLGCVAAPKTSAKTSGKVRGDGKDTRKCVGGYQAWVEEIRDTKISMEKKIRCCNVATKGVGWRRAAEMYWPLLWSNYVALREVLGQVGEEVRRAVEGDVGKGWEGSGAKANVTTDSASGAQAQAQARTVHFANTVGVRNTRVWQASKEMKEEEEDVVWECEVRDAVTNLNSERKDSRGRYRKAGMKTKGGKGKGKGKERSKEEEEETTVDGDDELEVEGVLESEW